MTVARHIFRVGLCLLAGVVISYGVAWWFEYERTSRVLYSAQFAIRPSVRHEGSFAWPVPTEQWPKDITPPALGPDRVFLAVESAGTDFWTFARQTDAGWFQVDEVASGWPWRCTSHVSFLSNHISVYPTSPIPDTRVWYGGWHAFDIKQPAHLPTLWPIALHFPLRPLWGGLAINTAIYGSIVWLLTGGVVVARRSVRRRRNQCEGCGYPRGVSPVCTECGRKRDGA